MASPSRDDVLSIGTESDTAFSGFSSEASVEGAESQVKKKLKSVVTKPKTVKTTIFTKTGTKCPSDAKGKKPVEKRSGKENVKAGTSKSSHKMPNKSVLDVTKLSQTEICQLRDALGIESQSAQLYAEVDEYDSYFGQPLENLPNIRVQVDSVDLSEGELCPETERVSGDMTRALFEEGEIGDEQDDDEWQLPRLKVSEKGKPVSKSLANMINVASTTQCDTDTFITKYKVPENCEKATPSLVNQDIWRILDKRAQGQDRSIVDIQHLVSAGITPVMKLAETLKSQIKGNNEAKTLISDALTILGQVQYHLSIRRRYMIRPNLKKKYASLCNIATPITTKLFGDEISKDIKNCDNMAFLGKDQPYAFRGQSFRGRGGGRFSRRGYGGYGAPSGQRYQPYTQRGFHPRGRGYPGRFTRRSATASATAPNDQQN